MSTNEKNNNVKYDTENWRVRVFASLPSTKVLVSRNMFGDVKDPNSYKCRTRGLNIIPIWHKSIYVSVEVRTITAPTFINDTKDQIDAHVNYKLTVSISDPVKYKIKIENDSDFDGIVVQKVEALLNDLLNKCTYEELANLDINIKNEKEPKLANLITGCKDIEDDYGLKIESIDVNSVNQSKKLSEEYEKNKEQELANQRMISEANAIYETEKKKVEAIAYRMKILKEQGLSKEEILKIIQTQIMIESGKAQFMNFSGDNTNAASFGAQFQAGVNMVNDNKQTQKKR